MSPQRFDSVAIAAGDRVDGFVQGFGNLREGEFAPNLQDNHFSLSGRKMTERSLHDASLLALLEMVVEPRVITAHDSNAIVRFAPGPPVVGTQQVQRAAAYGGVKERIVLRPGVWLMTPEADKGALNHVLGIRHGGHPLPGIKQEFRRQLRIAVAPSGFVEAGIHVGRSEGSSSRVNATVPRICLKRNEKFDALTRRKTEVPGLARVRG